MAVLVCVALLLRRLGCAFDVAGGTGFMCFSGHVYLLDNNYYDALTADNVAAAATRAFNLAMRCAARGRCAADYGDDRE